MVAGLGAGHGNSQWQSWTAGRALSLARRLAVGPCSGRTRRLRLNNGPGAILVNPGHYSAYHCDDLAKRRQELLVREKVA